MKSLTFQTVEEELSFYKSLLDTVPALININQADDLDDPTSSYNIWSNKPVHDFTGYTREEIDSLGFKFFLETMHADDMELVAGGIDKLNKENNQIFGGFVRLRPKDGDYHWFVGSYTVLAMKDGKPWRFLVTVQNLEDMNDTRNQMIHLVRENLQLKNQLRINTLSNRERHIIGLIAKGNTDREIAATLSISPATVKTHRHKIIQKLQLKNKAALAQFATESGLD